MSGNLFESAPSADAIFMKVSNTCSSCDGLYLDVNYLVIFICKILVLYLLIRVYFGFAHERIFCIVGTRKTASSYWTTATRLFRTKES